MHLSKKIHLSIFAFTALLAVSLSQVSSILVRTHLEIGESTIVAPFLWLTYVQNHGGIFGAFQGQGWVFALITLFILAGLVIYLIKATSLKLYNFICFGLIMGGGLSNILDRLLYGAVIDFIDIRNIPYWKYIFNTADTFIHLGIWPMLLLSLSELKHTNPVEPKNIQTPPLP
ncbi:signal peptidase II [bacterium]|nr:signal peptidase II [bacterium]